MLEISMWATGLSLLTFILNTVVIISVSYNNKVVGICFLVINICIYPYVRMLWSWWFPIS